MTLAMEPTATDAANLSQSQVHPAALQGLEALREAGLIRQPVDVENKTQCQAWPSALVKFDDEGHIISLDLGGCRLRKGLPDGILPSFEHLAKLETLNLGGTDLPVVQAVELLQKVASSLQTLHAGGNGWGDSGVTQLATDWISAATQLKTLDLRYNDISETGCQALCQQSSAIEKLYLEGNRLQNDGAVALAQWLNQQDENGNNTCPLQEIFLGSNQIGVAGAEALASCLASNRTLHKLYLEGNDIQAEGADAFAQALLDCDGQSALKHLFCDNNNIGKEASKRLAQALNSDSVIGESLLEG